MRTTALSPKAAALAACTVMVLLPATFTLGGLVSLLKAVF